MRDRRKKGVEEIEMTLKNVKPADSSTNRKWVTKAEESV